MTAVLVTHDIDEALLMADRVVVVSGPPGHITFEMPVTLPRPRDGQDIRGHADYPRMRRLLWDALNGPGAGAGAAESRTAAATVATVAETT
jgi:NitT/TauT family transport system ATP-binding protein